MYRFKGGKARTEFDHIVDVSFAQLLAIANGLVQETSLEAWEMLHIIMKAFKHAIYVGSSQLPRLGSQLLRLLDADGGISSNCLHI